jgi:hypothetical protein
LEAAKLLKELDVEKVDWQALANHKVTQQLLPVVAQLLIAEALCVNALPLSPALVLVKAGTAAIPYVVPLINNAALPAEVRVLAAIVLGAIEAAAGTATAAAGARSIKSGVISLTNAFKCGTEYGAGKQPGLLAKVLANSGGAELARKTQVILAKFSQTSEPAELAGVLAARGIPAAQVVALLEQFVNIEQATSTVKQLLLAGHERVRDAELEQTLKSAGEQMAACCRRYTIA